MDVPDQTDLEELFQRHGSNIQAAIKRSEERVLEAISRQAEAGSGPVSSASRQSMSSRQSRVFFPRPPSTNLASEALAPAIPAPSASFLSTGSLDSSGSSQIVAFRNFHNKPTKRRSNYPSCAVAITPQNQESGTRKSMIGSFLDGLMTPPDGDKVLPLQGITPVQEDEHAEGDAKAPVKVQFTADTLEHEEDGEGGSSSQALQGQRSRERKKSVTVDEIKSQLAMVKNTITDANHLSSSNVNSTLLLSQRGSAGLFSSRSCREACKFIVADAKFNNVIASLIILNSLVIGAETELKARGYFDYDLYFILSDMFFCLLFSVELVLQLCAQGRVFFLGKDWKWNCFDTIVVSAGTFESILMLVQMFDLRGFLALRIIRILRLARTLRVVRVLTYFRELRMVLAGIMNSMASLVWLILVLVLIMYIFAVYITQMVAEHLHLNSATSSQRGVLSTLYGNLGNTLGTLYMAISGGDDWGNLAGPLLDISQISGVVFGCYVTFAVFAVLNVVTGVFVGNAQKASEFDTDHQVLEEITDRCKHIDSVQEVFFAADSDGSGELTWKEFETALGDPRIRAYFRFLKLDVEHFGPDKLFRLFDFDGDGNVDIDEFVMGCTKLRGHARSLDVAMMHHDLRKIQNKHEEYFEEVLDRLGDEIAASETRLLAQMGQMATRDVSVHPP
eukprot:TRINITY_DN25236_c0_g1_i1.p1 TRINITY_DN25236_c0_g1~~TRINITY_DN25236_c0_g1_i1.p1  ORF type:complete len:675 (-),score=133.85 TRINITY_DN25236_c0_g1_i1:13-2037(-)